MMFAGVFSFFDRIFGTYVEPTEELLQGPKGQEFDLHSVPRHVQASESLNISVGCFKRGRQCANGEHHGHHRLLQRQSDRHPRPPDLKGETSLTDPKTAGMPQKTKEVVSNVLSSGNFEEGGSHPDALHRNGADRPPCRDGAEGRCRPHPCPPFGRSSDRGTYQGPRQPDGRRLSGMNSIDAIAFVEGMMLRDYAFDKYLTSKEEEDPEGPVAIDVQVEDAAVETVTEAIESLKAIVPGVHLARDLGNEPPNHLYPKEYARRATKGLRITTMSM